MDKSPKRILIVYDHREAPERMRLTIKHHLQALETSQIKHELVYFNTFEDVPTWVLNGTSADPPAWLANQHFDAVILHYSFLSFRTTGTFFFKWKQHFDWIGRLECLKIAIPQDEFDRAGLLDEWLFDWGVSVIFSVQYRGGQGPLYPIMRHHADFYECLPGYIDQATAAAYAQKLLPLSKRPYDIVYRARNLPYRFGGHARLKHQIAEVVQARAHAHNLNCNISTRIEDAILGDHWLDFLASGRVVIGCEGGTGVLDWHNEVEAMIKQISLNKQGISFEEVTARMPKGWDDYQFFTLTPRHLEAVITKTCQVLVEGEYRGVLEANKHYIPLKQDFSNLDEVLAKLKDHKLIEDVVEYTYQDIYLSGKYTYQKFAQEIERALYMALDQLSSRVNHPEEIIIHPDKPFSTLERQLVAERHRSILLQTELLEAKEKLAQLQSKLEVQTEIEALRAEFNSFRAELQTLQHGFPMGQVVLLTPVERGGIHIYRAAKRILMKGNGKKWFLFFMITALGLMFLILLVLVRILYQ